MPKASPLQPSFSGGEFSPRVFGRTDSERYKTGLATCVNYLPTIEGPIIRRSGTKYSGADAKDPSCPPVFFPFPVNTGDPFLLEFGEGYVRFFRSGGQVVTINSSAVRSLADAKDALLNVGPQTFPEYSINNIIPTATGSTQAAGRPLELYSPFNSSDIRQLFGSYQNGELYLTSPRIPPYKLSRIDDYNWTIKPIFPLLDGPYLPFNSDQETGDKFNVGLKPVTVPASIVDKIAYTFFETLPKSGITAYRNISSVNSTFIVALSTSTEHLLYTGQKVIVDYASQTGSFSIGGIDGDFGGSTRMCTVESVTNSRCVHVICDHTYTSLGGEYGGPGTGSIGNSTFVQPALLNKGISYSRLLSMSNAGKRYWGESNQIIASTSHTNIRVNFRENLLPNTNAISSWQLGVYYSTMNTSGVNFGWYWPKYNTFHQNRWVLSGSDAQPNEIVASVVGEFTDFRTSNSSYVVADNSALQFKLASAAANPVRWISSDSNGLLAGAYSSEFKISPSSQASALTPTNINAAETSFFGSEEIPAVKTGNATIYVQRSGRKVRELNYFFQYNTYRSTDLTQLSEHITAPEIVAMTNVQETIPAVWALRSDGQLLSMVYGRDDEALKAGWARHELGGQSDSGGSPPRVQSMAVITGSAAQYDSLWLATKRFINGTSVLNIEYMTKPFESDSLMEDAFFVDCGATYDNAKPITNITVAGSAVVTCPSHGLADGDQVQITKVVGLNTSVLDINGIEFNSNLVNYGIFRAASTTANTFFLTNVNNGSSYIDSRGYSPYTNGGEARKLISTISGVTWLTGETVSVLADGRVHPDVVVGSGGVVALEFSAAKVQLGLKYLSDGRTLRLDAGSGDGTAIGKIRRVARVAMQLYNVGEISVGMSFNKLTPMSDIEQFFADGSKSDGGLPLFSGIARDSLESSHDFDGQICFRQSQPMPGMVQSITAMLEENDV